jgi:hypothetical protein
MPRELLTLLGIPPTPTLLLGEFNWRGAWDAARRYDVNDVVSLFGALYVCISPHANQAPPAALLWDLYVPPNRARPGTPVNAVAATATLTLTDVVTDGETVDIGADTYEFDDNATVVAGRIPVDITGGATAAEAISGLLAAIAAEGTASVSAGELSETALRITAGVPGTAGNAISVSTDAVNGSWDGDTLAGGIDGTPGAIGEVMFDEAAVYIARADQTITGQEWRGLAEVVRVDGLQAGTLGFLPRWASEDLVDSPLYTDGSRVSLGATTQKLAVLTIRAPADLTDIGGTTTANGATTITGTGTTYLTSLAIGDRISLSSAPTVYAPVLTITSNTSLTVGTPLGNGTTQTINRKASVARLENPAATALLVVDDRGYHGIGTVKPGSPLEVVGDITSRGTLWVASTVPELNGWSSVTYGNGLYVGVADSIAGGGSGSRVMTSPDGINWTLRTQAESNTFAWRSVTFGHGLFVAVSSTSESNVVMTSVDGIAWALQSIPATSTSWNHVAYGNGLFVAVGEGGDVSDRIMTSLDGISWTLQTNPTDSRWFGLVYGNHRWVAVGYLGTNRVMTSLDGATWTPQTAASAVSWNKVAYGNGLFVATAIGGSGNRIMYSADGITWTLAQHPSSQQWYDIVFGDGLFVSVATSGARRIMTSVDGLTWIDRTAPAAVGWRAVTYGNGRFVALASAGNCMVSGTLHRIDRQGDNIRQGGLTVYGGLTVPTGAIVGAHSAADATPGLTGNFVTATDTITVTNGLITAITPL